MNAILCFFRNKRLFCYNAAVACRRICIFISIVALLAFITFAILAHIARDRTRQVLILPADGKAHWVIGLDGLHRTRSDTWPYPSVSKNSAAAHDEYRIVKMNNDWIECFDFYERFYIDRSPEEPPQPGDRVVLVRSQTLSIPFVPWLGTTAILILCWPLHGVLWRLAKLRFTGSAGTPSGPAGPSGKWPARPDAASA